MQDEQQAERQQFVEEAGTVFEQTGLPRMAGRIFGWLLISDPPQQSTEQLAEALMTSKGSISTMTRFLIQTGLIERLSLLGVRHNYFRLRSDALRHMVEHGIEDEVRMFRQLAEHGLELLTDKTSPTRKWLEEMRDRYAFFEQELPTLLERWEQYNNANRATSEASR
jgi:DNA-binding transcriptional regulator GbsR (MarR family)